MFCDQIRREAEVAPRAALPAVSAALWKAFAAGHVTEAEAESLSSLIEARQASSAPKPGSTTGPIDPDAPQDRVRSPRTGRNGSRPRTDASMERRRRWAASGRMPPAIAARFTLAEQSVLSLIAAETCRRKDCRLSVGGMAAIAGVSETTVRNAIREAVRLGLITVEERRITGWRNDTNVLRIVSAEWLSWLRLTRRSPNPRSGPSLTDEQKGGGCKSAKGTPTEVLSLCKSRPADPLHGLPRGSGRPDRQRANRNRGGR
ncbi:helix-turn-helix domain-containing protein [Methylorubrum thiocyanatum]|uniref:helix-turn-helix domain-containing protein n=1 Tax=Methylorubrum thiocyanatum TaxID=47958 RepID=UPI00398C5C38